MYDLPNLKKKKKQETFIAELVSWLCALGYHRRLFLVAAAGLCALSACFLYQLLCSEEASRGCAEQACSHASTEREFAALS